MQFKLKTPKHIQKYVVSRHGSMLTANFDDKTGQYLCLLIQNQPKPRRIRQKGQSKMVLVQRQDIRLPKEYDADVAVYIPDSKVLRGMNEIRNDTMTKFVSMFQDEFVREYLSFMDGLEPFKIPIVSRIVMFMEQFSLCEDDIKVETLKKIYFRHRKRVGGTIRAKRKNADTSI